ncbi:hypothetical protein ACFL6S_28945 [Candidatus Poribacteria bacterium]
MPSAYSDDSVATFVKSISQIVAQAEHQQEKSIEGNDGWLFFVPELRCLSVGSFWGDAAAKVSRASKPEHADPLPAILDFKAQLDKAGIELLFVPVPAKATIYPDALVNGITVSSDEPLRVDRHHLEFYRILEESGIRVLDLAPVFLKHRSAEKAPLYCKQDTHWSGQACVLTAKLIAEMICDREWLKDLSKRQYELQDRTVEITGDLWRSLGDVDLPKEQLQLTFVGERSSDRFVPVETWRESPVVLLGDSHNLVFHIGGDMHANGAGLADHLAHQLGFPVDLVASRGSGATPSRGSLARRRDNMKGKKLVIWCISVREFTEGQGWAKVPVIR